MVGSYKKVGGNMRILILGDTHVPSRAEDLPDWVKEVVEEGWDIILHTGDVEENWVLEYLSNFGKLYAVRGNMDYLNLPKFEIVDTEIGRFLLIHGHQVHPRGNREQLASLGRSAGARFVVSGHTHIPFMEERNGIVLLNPGTATGAWGGSYEGGEESLITFEDNVFTLWKNGEQVLRFPI